ncbi:MAG: SDR family oxidoreductase, partial [Planctomycetota bacterium]|nr:SDR family oxidoreductase [Planctomycetota bacterium]
MSEVKRVAVVTGASSGVGKATSQALLENGFDVVMAARRLNLIEEVIASFGQTSGRALAVQADVTREESVVQLFAKAREAFGRVDVLFNNAGISIPETPIENFSLEKWREALDI